MMMMMTTDFNLVCVIWKKLHQAYFYIFLHAYKKDWIDRTALYISVLVIVLLEFCIWRREDYKWHLCVCVCVWACITSRLAYFCYACFESKLQHIFEGFVLDTYYNNKNALLCVCACMCVHLHSITTATIWYFWKDKSIFFVNSILFLLLKLINNLFRFDQYILLLFWQVLLNGVYYLAMLYKTNPKIMINSQLKRK